MRERDYIDPQHGMHYALLNSAERIAPSLHCHEFFEVFLLLQGQLIHIVNGQRFRLHPGTLCFIRPADEHCFEVDKSGPCQMMNVAVARQTIEALWHYLGPGFDKAALLASAVPPTTRLSLSASKSLSYRVQDLNQLSITETAEKHSLLRILLFELLTRYFPAVHHLPMWQHDMPQWLRQTYEAMQRPENFSTGLSRMVALSGVSQAHLTRSVRAYLELTPTALINQLRLRYAANLLRHGDLEIIAVAHEVGFESLSYFYAKFKLMYGLTPKAFRQQHQPQGWQR